MLSQPEKKEAVLRSWQSTLFRGDGIIWVTKSTISEKHLWEQELPWILFGLWEGWMRNTVWIEANSIPREFYTCLPFAIISCQKGSFWSISMITFWFLASLFLLRPEVLTWEDICSGHSRVTLQAVALQEVYRYHLRSICDLGDFSE